MNATRMAVLTASILITASVWATDERSLDPCVNGEVSATGSYITQALEDRALQDALTTQVAVR
jgi:hypothetical protein